MSGFGLPDDLPRGTRCWVCQSCGQERYVRREEDAYCPDCEADAAEQAMDLEWSRWCRGARDD